MPEEFTIARALLEAAQLLRQSGVAEARREAASLLEHITGRDRTFLITHAETPLVLADVRTLRDLVLRRAKGEPLQYITGRQDFYGLSFEVTPAVLIPRPETELLVEKALELLSEANQPQPRICDVGTGTGCIPIAVLHEHAGAQAVGLDLSLPALQVAARNAARHGLRERVSLLASDCFAALDPAAARFSMIVSNPPYIAEDALEGLQREVRDHEPRAALTPGGDGLQIIRRLIEDAPRYLSTGGHLLMEIGFDQHEAVSSLIESQKVWELLGIHKDLQGIPRIVALKKISE
ncbi:MAG TPA: peptide chain release factor N(5)-glutamine methyltransferase [Pyrinomonadaceae bacterium]|nr:peptide chain release factor N(5)-glutamine methyltransferase [Pyrinomonadaceae bacterium]